MKNAWPATWNGDASAAASAHDAYMAVRRSGDRKVDARGDHKRAMRELKAAYLPAAGAAKRDGAWLARRDLSMRANGTIDTWYGCLIYDEMIDYALNFSAPWSEWFHHDLNLTVTNGVLYTYRHRGKWCPS